MTKDDVIRALELVPHAVEGGWYRETFRSRHELPGEALPGRYTTPRSLGTAIYLLLDRVHYSALHRTRSTEVYHHYAGAPVTMLLLYPDGSSVVKVLGGDLTAGQTPQLVVPHFTWQGAMLVDGADDAWALMGTTMSPGFSPADLETANHERLLEQYPEHKGLIHKLARKAMIGRPQG